MLSDSFFHIDNQEFQLPLFFQESDPVFSQSRQAVKGGIVSGVDFSPPMLAVARSSAAQTDTEYPIDFQLASADQLPYSDQTFDIAMVNGLFNLNPGRAAIIDELFRVLKPGAIVYAAEIVRTGPIQPHTANWLA